MSKFRHQIFLKIYIKEVVAEAVVNIDVLISQKKSKRVYTER